MKIRLLKPAVEELEPAIGWYERRTLRGDH
jgi:hypothetical protein